ncbi:MAG: 3-ketoacyl-ACP reductase [Phycisphaeraceae bacterium]|nr:3-ketoacyl-ACP reductase [Phycisphaeraceae bacterium]
MSQHPVRTTIVTGGSRGIGRGIAVSLGAQGYNVGINYNSNSDAADEAAKLVEEAGGKAITIQADIGNRDDHKRLLGDTVDAFGPVDLLINNAGIAPTVRADLMETNEESFDKLIAVNLKGPFFLTQLVANHMLENKDSYNVQPAIVNISSISADTVSVNRGEYCISKAGVAMTTQLFAARLAADGIGVYEIRPGIIATDMTGPVKEKYDKLIFEEGLLPIPRWGKPEDIANAVQSIADGHFTYATGLVMHIDGGFHIQRL